ncbi:MAG TPA: class I SAM-dependent methyltransferase [Gammaproteobacteria bacterium]|nr:class I SAM-dependent methyltransferase [Gammaproteobacteria bacterium]
MRRDDIISPDDYRAIENSLAFEIPLPVAKDWSAAADFLKLLSDFCLDKKPVNIVECSSGTSSLVLAKCCQMNESGHVYSLENGEEFAQKTRRQLTDFSLGSHCSVIHSPLENIEVNGVPFKWYTLDKLPVRDINVLVVDGPSGFIQKNSRYPALPLLVDRLAKDCVIFLDDAAREDEQALVRLWQLEFPEFQAEYIENERGCFVLRRC